MSERIPEKSYRGSRGPDKKQRNYNPISKLNLKQNQSITGPNKLDQFIGNTPQKQFSSWKLWIVPLIILGIIVGYFIYKYYKEKTKHTNSDKSLDFIGGETNNGQV